MEKRDLLDKLDRAFQMEEEMAGILIGLCQSLVLFDDIPEKSLQRIQGILQSIKADTLRHKDIVAAAQKRLSL